MEKQQHLPGQDPALLDYVLQWSSPPGPLLDALERETHLKTLSPNMLSGPFQGRLLSMISHLIRPRLAIEIGTFTGYASLCLAEGLAPDGCLHTFEVNPERESLIRKYVDQSPYADRIRLYIADAREALDQVAGTFDLVFIDAAKGDNAWYYAYCLSRLSPQGCILVDNTLWKGRVLDPAGDKDAMQIHAFNEQVHADPRVICLQLPIRDGLLMIRRRG